MESIALIGSIVAIAQIAGAATKLSHSLYRTACKAGSAKEEIQAFANDIGAFGSLIRMSHDSIRRHCERESVSSVLRFIYDHDVLGVLAQQSRRVKKNIEAVRPQIQDLRGRLSLVNHIKWVFKRADVKALHPDMECVKTNLLLMINVLALENAHHREPSKETRREIKSLKRQIEVHIQTISILRVQQQRASLQLSANADNFDFLRQGFLIQLAKSMVENGRVPEMSGSRAESERFPPSSSSSSRGPELERARTTTLNNEQSFYLQNPSDISRTTSSSVYRDLVYAPQTGEIVSNRATASKSESQTSIVNAPDSSTHPVERDYVAVRSSGTVLYLTDNRYIQGEAGLITTYSPDGKAPVTAVLDHELEGNVISQAFAIQNGLEVQELEGEDGVWVEFETGNRIRSMGQVVLEWSKELSHRQSFRVCCWVVAYNGRPLYFGKPYLEKRDHYWGSKSRRAPD